MSGILKLKEIGVQRIHEQTHISRAHIEAIFAQRYELLSKIQLMGFLSILEQEYKVDLSDEKSAAENFFATHTSLKVLNGVDVLGAPAQGEMKKRLLFASAIVASVFAIYALYESRSADFFKLDNSAIENAQKNMLEDVTEENITEQNLSSELNTTQIPVVKVEENTTVAPSDANATVEVNTTQVQTAQNETKESIATSGLKLFADKKMWLGFVDLASMQKGHKIFTGEFVLDGSKEYLLLCEHGYFSTEANGQKSSFSTKKIMRFAYQNGQLREITKDEFKELNGGHEW